MIGMCVFSSLFEPCHIPVEVGACKFVFKVQLYIGQFLKSVQQRLIQFGPICCPDILHFISLIKEQGDVPTILGH